MEYEILSLHVEDGIAVVTNSRPKALNALNSRFFREIDAMVAEIKSRDDVKVMVITGDGKAFAAGADIAEMKDNKRGGDDREVYLFSIGIIGGAGIEVTIFSWMSIFAEYNIGYTPVGKSSRNIEGHQVYVGITWRR